MGPTGCPETSARDYYSTLCKMPKKCRSQGEDVEELGAENI